MKYIIIILVYISYPELDKTNIEFYDRILSKIYDQYAFIGVKFETTEDRFRADLYINPCVNMEPENMIRRDVGEPEFIGRTYGNVHQSRTLYSPTYIEISDKTNDEDLEFILKHEFFHALLPVPYHSIDTLSLLYPSYDGTNKYLTRYDSLYLSKFFKRYEN